MFGIRAQLHYDKYIKNIGIQKTCISCRRICREKVSKFLESVVQIVQRNAKSASEKNTNNLRTCINCTFLKINAGLKFGMELLSRQMSWICIDIHTYIYFNDSISSIQLTLLALSQSITKIRHVHVVYQMWAVDTSLTFPNPQITFSRCSISRELSLGSSYDTSQWNSSMIWHRGSGGVS